ncbi:MAG: flagellar filament capping protein FliD [Bdellovibrionales bacterium]|nr:flagellar filament capping protein FliD [Bdellovibrionales bacterium]
MEAERIPIKTIERNKGKQENRLKLVQDLETKLNGITGTIGALASTKGFTDMKLNSGDVNVVSGVVDPNSAVNGNWNIEVVDLAQKAAAITNGFPDKDKTQIGVGYFRFDTPDGGKEIYINGANNTLEGVSNAINRSGIGVKATVLNDRSDPDNPYKLMITGDNVGNEHQVTYPTLYFLDGDQDIYFDEEREAKNGRVKVDGFEFEVGDNTVKDVIPGVTLELKQANPGRTVNVSVKEDKEVVTGKIKTFVDGVNAVLSFIQQQNTMNKDSDTSSTLGGDSLLRSIENRLRGLIQNPQMGFGEINRLNQLGIAFNRNGTLEYDEKKFNDTLAKNPSAVQRFLAGDGFATGFIPTLKREINTMLNSAFGPVAIRKRALQDRIGQMNDQVANKERQLAKKEDSLRNKFAKLEETMSKLKGQMGQVGAMQMGAPQG